MSAPTYFDARTGSAVGCKPAARKPFRVTLGDGYVATAASRAAAIEAVYDRLQWIARGRPE